MALTGRTALITGGARGIGRAISMAYLQAGAAIFVTAQSEKGLKEGIASLECEARKPRPGNGVHISGGVVDVRDQGAVDKVVDEAIKEMGEIDILVNNAGRGGGGPTLETQDKLWFDVIDV